MTNSDIVVVELLSSLFLHRHTRSVLLERTKRGEPTLKWTHGSESN